MTRDELLEFIKGDEGMPEDEKKRTEAEKMREDYEENKAEVAETIQTFVAIADEVLEEHGEDIGDVLGKYLTKLAVPIAKAIRASELTEEVISMEASSLRLLYDKLIASGFTKDEALEIICSRK